MTNLVETVEQLAGKKTGKCYVYYMGKTLYNTIPRETVYHIKDLKERDAEQEKMSLEVRRKGSEE